MRQDHQHPPRAAHQPRILGDNVEKLKTLWTRYFSSINAAIRAGLGLGIVFLFVLLYAAENFPVLKATVGFLGRLENQTYDVRLRATMSNKMDPRIVIIDVDEKTLAAEGRWPLSRDRWVKMLTQLYDNYKIKVVGFDVIFTEPDTSSGLDKLESMAQTEFKNNAEFQEKLNQLRPTLDYDSQFAEVLKKYPVVLAFAGNNQRSGLETLQLGDLPKPTFSLEKKAKPFLSMEIDGYSGNLKSIQEAAAATGHILPHVDFDGVLRRIPAFVKFKDGYYESLSIATFRTFLDNEPLLIKTRLDDVDGVPKFSRLQIGKTVMHLDEDATLLIPYRGPSPMYRYISATDVIRGKLTPAELQGKIALVGTSAQGLFDLRNTPVGEVYPGVETHANMLSAYLDNSLKQKPPYELAIKALIVMFLGIPLAIALVKLNPLVSTLTVFLTALAYIGFNVYWWNAGYVLPLAIPLLMILSLFMLNMAYGFFVEARSKRAITGIFGTYVPKELVAQMAENPDAYTTKGESRDMTVLFSDVRNFTSISEGLSPTELTAMMNDYLTKMTESIQTTRGTIDKYIGDAIMAFWGAPLADPKHPENALITAIEMQKRIRDIGPEYVKRGWPKLEIGVGLNCGVMNVGDMGSSFRRAYTVMGDAVNLASRLEALTKEYGVGILVSENIVKAVDIAIYREIDRVRVKGKLEPVTIYEPAGLKTEVVNQVIDEIDRFHRALDKYRSQAWDDAEAALRALSHADPKRKVYQLYLARIRELREQPPGANWDGVYTFTHK
ncbi:MAG: adenylate/guanylate cyclase domain-containing protein [Betaproteobacteria bacterium]|nr:adenylate/guanylate cyclase domain-containing protein [Betaproteobacteria bacterium]